FPYTTLFRSPEARPLIATGNRVALYRRDGAIVKIEPGVELRVQSIVEKLRGELVIGADSPRAVGGDIGASIAVALRVVAEIGGIPNRVEAGAARRAELQRIGPRSRPTGCTYGKLGGVV